MSFILDPDFTMENSLSYVIVCGFFATTVHQRIIFVFLVRTKLVYNSVNVLDFSLQYSWRDLKRKNGYLNYVEWRVSRY